MIGLTIGVSGYENVREGHCPLSEGAMVIALLLCGPAGGARIVTLNDHILEIEDSRNPASFIDVHRPVYETAKPWTYRFGQMLERPGDAALVELAMTVVGYVLLRPALASDQVRAFVAAKVAAMSA